MKYLKKTTALLLSVLLLFSAMVTGVTVTAEGNTATITAATVEAEAGANVDVPVTVETTGLAAAIFTVTVDGLVVNSYAFGDDFTEVYTDVYNNEYTFAVTAKADADVAGTATVVTLNVAVPVNAEEGTVLDVTVADATAADYAEADVAVATVNGSVTVKAAEIEDTKYTVTFKDADGTVLKTEEVEAGAAATAPSDPVSAAEHTYFAGWDVDFSNITEDTVVTAEYVNLAFRFRSFGLVLGGEITIKANLGVSQGSLDDENIKEYGLLVWEEDEYDAENRVYDEQYAVKADEEDPMVVLIPRYSTQMNDNVMLRAYAILDNGTVIYGYTPKNGVLVEQADASYSVVTYALKQIDDDNENITVSERLYINMLNYGAAAQKRFVDGVADEDLANATLADELKVVPEVTTDAITAGNFTDDNENVNSDTKIVSAGIGLASTISVEYKLRATAETGVKSVKILSWYESAYESAVAAGGALVGTESAMLDAVYNSSSSRWEGSSAPIYSNKMRDTIYARGYIEYEDGTFGYTQLFKYSAEAYAQNQLSKTSTAEDQKSLLKAMLAFGDASVARFGN